MQLYKIDERDVGDTIDYVIGNEGLGAGKHERVNYNFKSKYGYPLKVVFVIEENGIEIITAYPLRKERTK